ncbi:MAG: surface carbohydrate biosynthesis protein [Desulfovibrio sp.]
MTQLSKPTVGLPIEIKARELDYKVYLALAFAKEGYSTLIGNYWRLERTVRQDTSPYIYFVQEIKKAKIPFMHHIRKHKGVVVSLDDENGVNVTNDATDNIVLVRYEPEAFPYMSAIFSWGEAKKKAFERLLPTMPAEKIIVTGDPRFDLRKKEFNEIYKSKKNKQYDHIKNYILFNMAFYTCNGCVDYEGMYQIMERNLKEGFDTREYRLRYHYESIILQYHLEAITKLAETFPDQPIVVRPHPLEKKSTYDDMFADYDNVHVIFDGFAQEWIIDAAMVVHHDCTTGVEALFNGRPTVSYSPMQDLRLARDFPLLASHIIENETDLVEFARNAVAGKPLQQSTQSEAFLEQAIANVHFSSTDKVLSILEKLVEEADAESVPPIPENISFDDEEIKLTGLAKLWHKLKTRSTRKKDKKMYKIYEKHKFDGISSSELQVMIDSMRRCDPSMPEVTITQVEEDLYKISRK